MAHFLFLRILPVLISLGSTTRASASKLEELVELKLSFDHQKSEYLRSDLSPQEQNAKSKRWKKGEIASQNLARIATWLSTLLPRKFTDKEVVFLSPLFQSITDLALKEDCSWAQALHSLNAILNSNDILGPEKPTFLLTRIHEILQTGEKLTQSLKELEEPGIRRHILDFLPKGQAVSQAGINRAWRRMIHDYQKHKGYSSTVYLHDGEQLRTNLAQLTSLSQAEIESIIHDSEFYGSAGYQAFLDFIHKFFIEGSGTWEWAELKEDLLSVSNDLPKHSLLRLLVQEMHFSDYPSPISISISGTGLALLGHYKKIAEEGNVYAIQTLKYLYELLSYLDSRNLPCELDQKDLKLSKSIPDIHRWLQAYIILMRGNSLKAYTHAAALSRLYRQSYLQLHRAPEPFVERGQENLVERRKGLILRAKRQVRTITSLMSTVERVAQLSEEASYHADAGDPQRALCLLEIEGFGESSDHALATYDRMAFSRSKQSLKQFLKGRDEAVQKRILNHLVPERHAGSGIEYLIGANQFKEAYELSHAHKNSDNDQTAALTETDRRILEGFYEEGVLESIKLRTQDEPTLSRLDSVVFSQRPCEWAKQTASKDASTDSEFSHLKEKYFLTLVSQMEPMRSVQDWSQRPIPSLTTVYLLSDLKRYDLLISLYRQHPHLFQHSNCITLLAHALLTLGQPEEALEVSQRNFPSALDHETRVKALRKLGRRDQLNEAIAQQEEYEREYLLLDLRKAAKIYLEDADLNRARQALVKAHHLSKKLNDPDASKDEDVLNEVNREMREHQNSLL